jgi:hypothetical protein
MNGRRWALSFVISRWRYLFWVLPLLGLLAGSAFEWQQARKKGQARSLVRLRAPMLPSLNPLFATPSPPLTFSDIRDIVFSDRVLANACHDAMRLDPRDDAEDEVRQVRAVLTCEEIAGTPDIAISIRGKKTPATIKLCNAVTSRARERVKRLYEDAVRDELERLEAPPAAERVTSSGDGMIAPTGDPLSEEESTRRARILAQQRLLRDGSRRLAASSSETPVTSLTFNPDILQRYQRKVGGIAVPDALGIREWARASPPPTWRERLQQGMDAGVWVGVAVVIAGMLAYLLEFLLPTKAAGTKPEAPCGTP